MIVSIMLRWLRTHRAGLLGWSAGLIGVTSMYLPFYTTVALDPELMDQYMSALPPEVVSAFGFDDITSPGGYVHSTVFGLLGLVLVLIAGITRGVRAIAGDEQTGSLETEVTAAVDRRDVYIGRALGVTVFVVILGLVTGVATALISGPSGLDLPLDRVAAGVAALTLLGVVHALIALAVGAATGRSSIALGVAVVAAVLGYFAHNLGPMIAEGIERFSPFYWAYGNRPLSEGFDWGGLGLLLILTVVAFVAGLVTFPRRDLGV